LADLADFAEGYAFEDPVEEAKWADGLFANQNIICRLWHPATIELLKKHFPESVTNREEPPA